MSYAITAPIIAVPKKSNFETKQSVLKAPMQLRISLQRSHYNVEKDTFCKNKTKIALSAQYFMSYSNDLKVIYVLVSIKYHIGNDMYQGQYLCDVLDYNTDHINIVPDTYHYQYDT